MSSITPLLDTLVQHVAKQRAVVDLLPRHTLPVTPIPSPASTTEFSQAGQQLLRLATLIQTFQQQQPPTPSTANFIQSTAPLLGDAKLDVLTLVSRLQQLVKNSGIFYESAVARWAADKLPFSEVRQQPQNLGTGAAYAPKIQQILGQQLDLLQTGVLRMEFELWPQAVLQWLVQPDVHPLVQRWRDEQRRKQGEPPEPPAWQSELKLTVPGLGELRAQMHLREQQLNMQLQCAESWVEPIQQAAPTLVQRLRDNVGVSITEITVLRLPHE